MKVKLSDLELPQVQEVAVHDRRSLAEHKAPSMSGSMFQNLGRHPAGIFLWGVATGPQAFTFIEKLDAVFRSAKPVPFTADIVTGAGIKQIFIADLQFQELAGKPQRFAYALSLNEFIRPSMATDHSALNAGIRSQAKTIVGRMAANLTRKK